MNTDEGLMATFILLCILFVFCSLFFFAVFFPMYD